MKARNLATALFGLVIVASACSKKTPPPAIAPTAQPVTQAPAQRPQLPPAPTNTPQPSNVAPGPDANAVKAAALADIAEKIHFDFDKADISSADAARLDRKAAIMRANPALKIRIIGHCDERGSDSYNIALGMKRASAAKDYLVKAGVNAANIEINSLGRESPIDRGKTEDAWTKNRRDEFEATGGTQTIVAPR